MSLPVTSEEWKQYKVTESRAGLTENVVSTACPECELRFVLLAHYSADGWTLRCAGCGWKGAGELKPREAGG